MSDNINLDTFWRASGRLLTTKLTFLCVGGGGFRVNVVLSSGVGGGMIPHLKPREKHL